MPDYDVMLADLPESLHQIAQEIGLEACLRLVRMYSGDMIYVPKYESVTRAARNRAILADFTGGNYRELAHMHGLAVAQVREIVRGERRKAQPSQAELFG